MMNNLAKFRGKHTLTQEQMAEKLGVTKACVSYYENKKTIAFKVAQKYAEVLNENIIELLGKDVFLVVPKNDKEKKLITKILREI